ncbi:RNA polymerase sigma factor [Pedobacter duraquae]|uniref:RNA polymerase sigma factor n=1 Tax=Pedobacter duraquae TaxID=425511 RepID=A0A4R6IG33_9SPHI|nr:RNA polymerase sigma factor [Pedobacter duraquae]TDO21313.1 RNA polymerase sigma-70 factor (ECF subfamily) [Pedobacter duraquae]
MVFKKAGYTEDDYLKRAIRGERIGLEYLVQTYQSMAYTIAIRIVKNSEDAEEVVQDSFLKAFKYLSDFRGASKFSTWLYRIVYHTALSKIQRVVLLTSVLDESTQYITDTNEKNDPWLGLVNADRQKYIGRAIDQLKEDDRVVITLHYIAEKSITEISEITGLGRSAIKMRLLRGRHQLEVLLKRLLIKEFKEL